MGYKIRILVTSGDDEDSNKILSLLSGQEDFYIAGIAKDETGAIIQSERLKPDVLIIDLKSSGMSIPELAPIIHRRSPATAIILLSDKDEDLYAIMALNAGISGFLLKKTDTDMLALAVKTVFYGGCYINASIAVRIFNDFIFKGQSCGKKMNVEIINLLFSPMERGIITNIAQGFSDEEIAKHLNYSAGTIKNCLTAIKRKTKLKNRVQIVIFSIIYGIINLEHLDNIKTYSFPFENNRHILNDRIQ